jgi:putative peptide maturation dehydrogenase
VMTMPADRWLTTDEVQHIDADVRARLLDLAARGVLQCDPAAENWGDLTEGEEILAQMQWHDLAAVYQAHSRWNGISGAGHLVQKEDQELEDLRKVRGDPPSHFVQRSDAQERVPLSVPPLDGPFFDTLLARRTTRAYRSECPLPRPALELMLYAVFGAQGIKSFADGVAAIKRTSPSAGALHPIEAYVLAINVQEIPVGLYHYEVGEHALARLEIMDRTSARNLATEFTAGQAYFAEAHALVVHVARFDRNFWKYAQHRKAYKAVLMDSAHLSQTLHLTAAHLGLGAFYTAAINDGDIALRLRLRPVREAAIAINGFGIADGGREELLFAAEPYRPIGIG